MFTTCRTIACASFLGLFLVATTATAAPERAARPSARTKPPATRPTTQPGQWVDIGKGVRARMFFGVWFDKDSEDNRPGHAARIVRLIPGTEDERFGVSLSLDLPPDFTGDLSYRERLTLPAKPRTWDHLNQAMREMLIDRTISADGKTSIITETMRFNGGFRILTFNNEAVDSYPAPFAAWDFDPTGDPTGEWSMECWMNETYLGKYTFQVVHGKKGDTNPVVIPDPDLDKLRPPKVWAIPGTSPK